MGVMDLVGGLLPQVVDKLSPQGSLPEGGGAMDLLKQFLGCTAPAPG